MPTKIEWAEETWNPITGCTKISEGCRNCYAERMAKRLAGRYGYPEKPNQFRPTFHTDQLGKPLKWKKPRRIFVCSMGDLFHPDVDPDALDDIMGVVISDCPQHTFLFLTKRPKIMRERLSGYRLPKNLWIGVTAENQERLDERLPVLIQIPAAVRFVSIEPMLSRVYIGSVYVGRNSGLPGVPDRHDYIDPLRHIAGINWVICGGESGPGARPMHPDWVRSLRDQCVDAGVPFFMKQMSGKNKKERMAIPDDLMIKEYPNTKDTPSIENWTTAFK